MIRVTRVRVWLVVRSLLVYILINLILIVIRSEMHYMKKWFEMNFERIHRRNNKTKKSSPLLRKLNWGNRAEKKGNFEIQKYGNLSSSISYNNKTWLSPPSPAPEEITKARKAFIQSPGNSIPWRTNFTAGFVQVFKILVKSNRDSMFGFDIKKRTVGIDCPGCARLLFNKPTRSRDPILVQSFLHHPLLPSSFRNSVDKGRALIFPP